jgi:alpha-2-macroglobulin
LERIARRGLGLSWFGFVMVLVLAMPTSLRAARPVTFNLSTAKTFAPGEKPRIHLYSQNVDELEFRVCVDDPAKFLSGLKDLHSFGEEDWGLKERVDERTWLEKFHDWKHHIWFLIRRFFRDQFSMHSRDELREKQAKLARRSRVVGVRGRVGGDGINWSRWGSVGKEPVAAAGRIRRRRGGLVPDSRLCGS